MTPEQKAYEAALREHLADRARLLLGANVQVQGLLKTAREDMATLLAQQSADGAQWRLQQLKDRLDVVLNALAQDAGVAVDGALRSAWQQGEDFVDAPLAAAKIIDLQTRLGALDPTVLAAMRAFSVDRIRDVTDEARSRIGRQLALVTIGGTTPYEAIQQVHAQLGGPTVSRAATIVNTEVSRAFAVASQARMEEAVDYVPDLEKQWRRSGKIHSRVQHDLMDGVRVPVNGKFKVPNPNGGHDMMTGPHDPAAPPEQVIHCGCVARPWRAGWQMQHPGAKPFTELERKLDGRKAALDQAAKRAGLRAE
jgi:hypothetical protein